MDKLLNLLAAIQDENWRYRTHVAPVEQGDWDFYVNAQAYMPETDSISFNHDKMLEALRDFEEHHVSTYTSTGVPLGMDAEDATRHEVEIRVRA